MPISNKCIAAFVLHTRRAKKAARKHQVIKYQPCQMLAAFTHATVSLLIAEDKAVLDGKSKPLAMPLSRPVARLHYWLFIQYCQDA
jgi:hypothetical protein